jgi:hypothetical protein
MPTSACRRARGSRIPGGSAAALASHSVALDLALNNREHGRPQAPGPQTQGFVERFRRRGLDGFCRPVFRETFYESVVARQADLDTWLAPCYTEPRRQGGGAMGRRPVDTVRQYLATVRHED